MLHVERGIDVDARVAQLFDIHPAFGVARAGCIRMRQLVDEDERRPRFQRRIEIELGQPDAAMLHFQPWQDRQALQQCFPCRRDHAFRPVRRRLQCRPCAFPARRRAWHRSCPRPRRRRRRFSGGRARAPPWVATLSAIHPDRGARPFSCRHGRPFRAKLRLKTAPPASTSRRPCDVALPPAPKAAPAVVSSALTNDASPRAK